MNEAVVRGDGVGIEVADSILRGVRLRHNVNGRLSSAAELPINIADDDLALDAFVLLRAELGEPNEPTRLATFPTNAMLQRIDITGRSGPELNELRSMLDRRHGINSTVVTDDGPRRWLLAIRWDAHATRRLEELAERAGFVDVAAEPSPMAVARVIRADATYVRRLVAQGDTYHAVISNRIPVAALGVSTTGRDHPDVDVSSTPVNVAHFDDFMSDAALGAAVDRIMARVDDDEPRTLELDIVGDRYPGFPVHDHRSAQRQAVALGAAVGAAGLAGPLRPVDTMVSSADAVDAQFDRPWAVEAVSTLPDLAGDASTSGMRRLTRHLRPRNRR
jgi:hypothetical protein